MWYKGVSMAFEPADDRSRWKFQRLSVFERLQNAWGWITFVGWNQILSQRYRVQCSHFVPKHLTYPNGRCSDGVQIHRRYQTKNAAWSSIENRLWHGSNLVADNKTGNHLAIRVEKWTTVYPVELSIRIENTGCYNFNRHRCFVHAICNQCYES